MKTMKLILLSAMLLASTGCEEIAKAAGGTDPAAVVSDGTIQKRTQCKEIFNGPDFQVYARIEKTFLPNGSKVLGCSTIYHMSGASKAYDISSSNTVALAAEESDECTVAISSDIDLDGNLVVTEATFKNGGIEINGTAYSYQSDNCNQVYPK